MNFKGNYILNKYYVAKAMLQKWHITKQSYASNKLTLACDEELIPLLILMEKLFECGFDTKCCKNP